MMVSYFLMENEPTEATGGTHLFFLIRAATMASPIPFNELHLTVCREYWVWPAWICWGPGVWIILMICACPSLCTDVTGSFHSGAIRSTDQAIIGLCMSLYGYVIFSNSPSQTFLPGIKGWFYLKMRQTCIYFNKLIIIELNIRNMWCTHVCIRNVFIYILLCRTGIYPHCPLNCLSCESPFSFQVNLLHT